MNTNEIKISDSKTLAEEIVKVLIEKQANNVKMFNVQDKTSVTDFYVNATARSSTHVGSLSDDVDEKMSELGRAPLRVEGRQGNSWILIDFGDVIVNVFDRESRQFYDFDRLLPEDGACDIEALVAEVNAKFEINKN